MCVCVLWYACRGQRARCRSHFSPVTWVSEIDLRSSGLVADALPAEPSCWALSLTFTLAVRIVGKGSRDRFGTLSRRS